MGTIPADQAHTPYRVPRYSPVNREILTMIDWQAIATPTGRVTKEHAYEAKGMVQSNYVGVSDATKHRIAEDHDLSDSWYFHDTALATKGDVWDNRRKAHAA